MIRTFNNECNMVIRRFSSVYRNVTAALFPAISSVNNADSLVGLDNFGPQSGLKCN